MKKIIGLLTIFITLILISSCSTSHEHDFKSEYSYDVNYHYHECNECDEVSVKEKHSFSEWTQISVPTYTKKGTQERTCSVCSYKETGEIDVIAHTHSYSEWIIYQEATLETPGIKRRTCSICGDVQEENYTITKNSMLLNDLVTSKYNIVLENISLSYVSLDNTFTLEIKLAELLLDFSSDIKLYGYISDEIDDIQNYTYLIIEANTIFFKKSENSVITYLSHPIENDLIISGTDYSISLEDLYSYVYYYNNVLTPNIKAYLADASAQKQIDDIFEICFNQVNGVDDYRLSVNLDGVAELNDKISKIKISQYIDSKFGQGTYNSIKTLILMIPEISVGNLLEYLNQLEINLDEILKQADDFYYNITGKFRFFSTIIEEKLNISLAQISLTEFLNLENIKNLKVRTFLVSLGLSSTEVDSLFNTIVKTLSSVSDLTVYEAIILLAGIDTLTGTELKELIDNTLTNLKDKTSILVYASKSGKLDKIELSINNYVDDSINLNISKITLYTSYTSTIDYTQVLEEITNNIKNKELLQM